MKLFEVSLSVEGLYTKEKGKLLISADSELIAKISAQDLARPRIDVVKVREIKPEKEAV